MKYSRSKKQLIFSKEEESIIKDCKCAIEANKNNIKSNHRLNILVYLTTGTKLVHISGDNYRYDINKSNHLSLLDKTYNDGLYLMAGEIYLILSEILNHRDENYNHLAKEIVIYNTYARDTGNLPIKIESCCYLTNYMKFHTSNLKNLLSWISISQKDWLDNYYRERDYGFNLLKKETRTKIVDMIYLFEQGKEYRDKIENLKDYGEVLSLLCDCDYNVMMTFENNEVVFKEVK